MTPNGPPVPLSATSTSSIPIPPLGIRRPRRREPAEVVDESDDVVAAETEDGPTEHDIRLTRIMHVVSAS